MFEKIVQEAGQHPSKNYLIIVPEQFTLATQQTLVELAPNHAIMNIDVLSFKRLAYRVFDDMAIRDLNVLEETGKNLVLRKVAQEREEELTVLRPNMNRMGYIGELKSLISEFVQYNITPDQLERYAGDASLPAAFSEKLRDIVTMYRGFETYIEGTCITAEEILNLLISVADKSALLRDSVLVFDEFTGFTPIQNRLFHKILPIVDRVHILLTIDERENLYSLAGEHELFYLTKKTIRTLNDMARELGVECLAPVILKDADKKRFSNAPDLAFLEQNLFRTWYKKSSAEVRDIQMASLKDAKEELVWIARQINHLVQDFGYRYRDIAIVTGSVELYGNYADEIFSKYRIPYFMDQTTEILFHPFIEFVRAALQVVETGFDYEPVIRFLRCGFSSLEEDEIDILDNYLVATGIRGTRAWEKRWLRMPRRQALYDLEKLEEIRCYLYDLFAPLMEAFSGKNATAAAEITALYEFFCRLGVEEQLWAREQEFLVEGSQVKSKEYGQIYQIVIELLEKFYRLLGEEYLSISEFTEILEAGLSASKVASVPPGYDNVTIGDIERTRLNYTKILFFAGVNDGVIPKAGNSGGIISEYEREMLQEAHMELAPGAREKAFIQRFYLYRNLTKPSDKIYISYARVDSEGKKIRPSYLIDVVIRMFPKLAVAETDKIMDTPDYSTASAAWDYLIHGQKDAPWFALAKYFTSGEAAGEGAGERADRARRMEELLKAPYAFYHAEPISKAAAEAVYGRTLHSSVTRLEQFAACAYAHFLRYGLRIEEREESGFAGVDIGNLYHAALQKYSERVRESEFDWFHITDEKREEFAELSFHEAVEEYSNMSIYDSAEYMHMADRMLDIFKQTTWALTKQVQAGDFVPTDFELSFSGADDMESLKVRLDDDKRMQLLGRIDRLDLSASEGKVYVKIIDYKSGSTKFDLIRIYRGLSLQLVVYMNAALEYTKQKNENREVLPAGILYYHIDDPVLEVKDANAGEEELREDLLLSLRPDGLINSEEDIYRSMDRDFEKKSLVIPVEVKKDGTLSERGSHVASTEEFEIIEEYVKKEVVRQAERIYDGEVAVDPYRDGKESSCTYCPYTAVCGINSRIPGYGFRRPEELTKDEVLERMKR
jgi:ATP-dependent helicase/nuclease subunit B